MRILMMPALFVLLATLSHAQDILILKGSADEDLKILQGRVLNLTETEIEFEDDKGARITLPLSAVEPMSLYRVKAARIEDSSAEAHAQLGEWCFASGLYLTAAREFETAISMEASRSGTLQARIRTCRDEDARTRIDEAKRLILQKKYEQATQLLTYVMKNYADTPYGESARQESDKALQALKADNDERQRKLEGKKKAQEDAKAQSKQQADRKVLTEIETLLVEVQAAFTEGLDWEAKDNLTKCRKAWETAETKLEYARERVEPMTKVEDAALLLEVQALLTRITDWRVRVSWRLGRNYAEQLSYTEALRYLNKALALPHDDSTDRLCNELLLTITQLRMRKRATGSGY